MEKTEEHSNSFCILPWIHLSGTMDRKISLCCRSQPLFDQDISLQEAWNSTAIRQIRLDMLAGKKVEGCAGCYQVENCQGSSLRQESNEEFKQHHHLVELTQEDGSLPYFSLKYLDLKLSNYCNLSCRTCGPQYSSAWQSDYKRLHNKPFSSAKGFMLEDWSQHLDQAEKIYFSGGEPLLNNDHYKALEYLLRVGRNDVHLLYNTNFSFLGYKENNVLDLWSQFKHVTLDLSLDGIENAGEYIRKGLKWSQFMENYEKVKKQCPHIRMHFHITVCILNLFHLTEMFSFFAQQGLLEKSKIKLNFLKSPTFLSIDHIPFTLKQRVKVHYQEFIQHRLFPNYDPSLSIPIVQALDQVLKYLATNESDQWSYTEFARYNENLDKIRKEKFSESLPILSQHLEHLHDSSTAEQ